MIMSFKGTKDFSHARADKIGVLIMNLGTPSAPRAKELRSYLREFLSDPRVVEIPKVIWYLILYLIILPLRAPKSAHAYQTVWTEKGSPLLLHSLEQRDALRASLGEIYGDKVIVELAMRYNQPAVSDVLTSMQEQGVRKLVVLPLYPQYAASTTASAFDSIAKEFMKRRWLPDLRFISHYHKDTGYIEAMASRIQQHWEKVGKSHLMLSFHGTPKRSLLLGDPYHCECHASARLLAERLNLSSHEYTVSFQSRFGKAEWLQPYTDTTLKNMPSSGIKAVDVFCPGFSSDCLETLEEICVENRDYFVEAGGEQFHYINALNSSDEHISALTNIIMREIGHWTDDQKDDLRQSRALKLGASK